MASKQVATAGGTSKQAPPPTQQKKPGLIESIRIFVEEVQTEMKKVSWPTQDELKSLTQLVLWSLLISGIVVGLFDLVFMNIMSLILRLG